MKKKQIIREMQAGLVLAILSAAGSVSAEPFVTANHAAQIGDYLFETSYNSDGSCYDYVITDVKSGAQLHLDGCGDGISDGKTFYAAQNVSTGGLKDLVKMDLESGRVEKLFTDPQDLTGRQMSITAVEEDRYLYYGVAAQYPQTVFGFRVYDMETGMLVETGDSGGVVEKLPNGRMLVTGIEPHGSPTYIIDPNGENKNDIAMVYAYEIRDDYIYYVEMQNNWDARVCRCSFDGEIDPSWQTEWTSYLDHENMLEEFLEKYA